MKKTDFKLLFLLFTAFIIRFIALDQSFWLDEATTAVTITKFSYASILSQFSPNDFHPPLYYLFMKWWSGIFGTSEIALRMPSVIFSLLTGGLICVIGSQINRNGKNSGQAGMTNLGFWSAALFLFNPLIVYYSQEARMYMMATFFIACNFYFYLKLKENITFMRSLFFILTIVLSMSTFFGSIFYVGSLFLYTFFKKEFKIFALCFISLIGSIVLLYPLLSLQMKHSGIILQEVKNWRSTLGTVTIKQLVLFPLKFSTGRISFEPKTLYFLIGGLWSGFLILLGLRSNKSEFGKTISFFTITPVILGIIFSLHTPLLQYFRFQFVIIFFSILLVISLVGYSRLRSIVLLGLLAWSLVYLINPSFHREDWKQLGVNLTTENKPVYIIATSSDPLHYYAPYISPRSLQSLSTQLPAEDEIIIIPYTADIHGVNYKEMLQNKYELSEQKHVRGIDYEIWKKVNTVYAGSF